MENGPRVQATLAVHPIGETEAQSYSKPMRPLKGPRGRQSPTVEERDRPERLLSK